MTTKEPPAVFLPEWLPDTLYIITDEEGKKLATYLINQDPGLEEKKSNFLETVLATPEEKIAEEIADSLFTKSNVKKASLEEVIKICLDVEQYYGVTLVELDKDTKKLVKTLTHWVK